MAKDYRHDRALAEQLGKHVDADTQGAILDNMDYVTGSSRPEVKVGWAREIMQRMDRTKEKVGKPSKWATLQACLARKHREW